MTEPLLETLQKATEASGGWNGEGEGERRRGREGELGEKGK